MKHAIAAAALVLAVSAGFVLWIAADMTPRTEFVPHTEPALAPEPGPSYLRAVHSPLHFRPAIEAADDAQCLACHREVIEDRVRPASPSGLKADTLRAAYQETPTYAGEQDTFHRRHLVTPLAQQLMNLRCNTCHQGHDPREEAQGASADSVQQDDTAFTLRKQVNPETVCLKCHGQFPWQLMGLPGPWEEHKAAFGNNCLTCHAAIRTKRHEVTYLNAAAIEQAGKDGADACFGCHGGRAWYRIAYPYARTPWPEMPAEVPEWAKDRPKQSEARFLAGARP
jgi:nitrate/TMAO reductase-like tetraheme cytochrome c subunit